MLNLSIQLSPFLIVNHTKKSILNAKYRYTITSKHIELVADMKTCYKNVFIIIILYFLSFIYVGKIS